MKYRAIMELTFSDLYGQILCTYTDFNFYYDIIVAVFKII